MEVGTNFDSLGHAVTTMMIWSLRRKLAVFWHLSQLLEVHSAQFSSAQLSWVRRYHLCTSSTAPPRAALTAGRQVAFILFETCCIPPSFGAEKSPDPSWKYVMIIALARLQFCRLSKRQRAFAAAALCAGKCPRGNGQIDSRGFRVKAKLATKRSWIGARVRGSRSPSLHVAVERILKSIF